MDDREDRNVVNEEVENRSEESSSSNTEEEAIIDEVKIEEVGIDGMCGVY